MRNLFLALALLCMAASPAFAADDTKSSEDLSGPSKAPPKVIYKKRTAVSFDDAVVEGQTTNPEGVYVVTPPEKQFGSLLKLRPNFHRELMRDALLLK